MRVTVPAFIVKWHALDIGMPRSSISTHRLRVTSNDFRYHYCNVVVSHDELLSCQCRQQMK